MKPPLINTGNGCKWCDGYGIMAGYAGTDVPVFHAPCLECSPKENINDLMRERKRAIFAYEKSKELKLIDDHNERINKKTAKGDQ